MNRISQRQLDRITPQLRRLLAHVATASHAPALTLLSGLAEGTDRHVAHLALQAGHGLHAVLPFGRETYLDDFHGEASRLQFKDLLTRATQVTELTGRRGFAGQAYRRMGSVILDEADVLMAVWDGQPAQGAGGTGEVVDEACRRRIPVIHVSTHECRAPVLIWRRLGRARRGRCAYEAVAARPCGPMQLMAMVSQVMKGPR